MNGKSKRPKRATKRTVLIVCEGKETERNYFDGLKRTDEVTKNYAVRVIPGKGGSRLQIVQHAVKQQKSLNKDECWCVLDTERLNNPETKRDFQDALDLAAANNIELAISNPSFEVWLVAHFQRTSRTFNDGDAAVNYLDSLFKATLNRDYEKNDKDIFDCLRDRLSDAIANAANVREHDHGDDYEIEECNSSSTVDELVTRLLNEPKKK